jgi:hypothetical protein
MGVKGVRPTAARNVEIVALSDAGWGTAALAARFGISMERVRQILRLMRARGFGGRCVCDGGSDDCGAQPDAD